MHRMDDKINYTLCQKRQLTTPKTNEKKQINSTYIFKHRLRLQLQVMGLFVEEALAMDEVSFCRKVESNS